MKILLNPFNGGVDRELSNGVTVLFRSGVGKGEVLLRRCKVVVIGGNFSKKIQYVVKVFGFVKGEFRLYQTAGF